MGMRIVESQGGENTAVQPSRPIVSFDFDGTLTVTDTFLAFLRWRQGAFGFGLRMALLGPSVALFLVTRNVEKLKSAALRLFFKGAPLTSLDQDAEDFAAVAAPKLLRPDALATWRRHQEDGALMVIVTASPARVIAPFAKRLGADLLLGTELELDDQGRLTGAMDGRNCRGPEKVRRLRTAFGQNVHLKAAYGDTDGDVDMLGIADYKGMKVFTAKP